MTGAINHVFEATKESYGVSSAFYLNTIMTNQFITGNVNFSGTVDFPENGDDLYRVFSLQFSPNPLSLAGEGPNTVNISC